MAHAELFIEDENTGVAVRFGFNGGWDESSGAHQLMNVIRKYMDELEAGGALKAIDGMNEADALEALDDTTEADAAKDNLPATAGS